MDPNQKHIIQATMGPYPKQISIYRKKSGMMGLDIVYKNGG